MNVKIQELIDKKIEEQKAQKEQKKRQHLIELGLTTGRLLKIYVDDWGYPNAEWDVEEKRRYVTKQEVIDVTEEEYAELCKFYPEKEDVKTEDYGSEKTLKVIASLVLIVGLILAVVGIVLSFEEDAIYLLSIALLLPSLTFWALMKCIANMSRSLKEIRGKIK